MEVTTLLSPCPEDKKQERKVNCWEFKKCEREPGGNRVDEEGECPAPMDTGHRHLKRSPSRSLVFQVLGIRWRLLRDSYT